MPLFVCIAGLINSVACMQGDIACKVMLILWNSVVCMQGDVVKLVYKVELSVCACARTPELHNERAVGSLT